MGRHIAFAGDRNALAVNTVVMGVEHGLHEIDQAKSGCLHAHRAAAKGLAFTGERAVELTEMTFVGAEQIADFARADIDVASRNIPVRTDMVCQLGHEGLAKPHDFALASPARVEIGATFPATKRQAGERVFENLLKAEKFQDRRTNGWVKADAALVRTDGIAGLHAPATIDLHLAFIILPDDPEGDDPVRFA